MQEQPRFHAFKGDKPPVFANDAELECVDADDAGRLLLLVWNVAGASELELVDTLTHERTRVHGLPGLVATMLRPIATRSTVPR